MLPSLNTRPAGEADDDAPPKIGAGFRYSAIANPHVQRDFKPQIRQEIAQERTAGIEARRQAAEQTRVDKTAASAAEKQRREQERQGKDLIKEQQRQRNDQLERAFRREERPHYVNAHGDIEPAHPDEEWQTIKSKRDAEKAEKLRRDTLQKDIDAVEASTTLEGLQRPVLNDTERTAAQKSLREATREAVNNHLTPALSTAAQQKDTGAWWSPFDTTTPATATRAQERLTGITERLTQADSAKAPVDLDDEDFADLTKAAPQVAQRITATRERLKAHEQNAAWLQEQKVHRAELILRRDNPAAWEQRQRESILGRTDPQSAAEHAQQRATTFEQRATDWQERREALEGSTQSLMQEQEAIEQENSEANATGLTAGEIVTLETAEGTFKHYRRDLADRLLALQQRGQLLEQEQAPVRSALAAEAEALERDRTLAMEAHEHAQRTSRENRAGQLDKLRLNPSFAPVADAFAALEQEATQRRDAIDMEMWTDGSPEKDAALAALEQDLTGKHETLQTAMQAKREAGAQLYAGKGDAATLGLTPPEAAYWSNYYEKADFQKGNVDDTARTLPDGSLAINPTLWTEPAKARQAVEQSTASADEKQRVLENLPAFEDAGYAALLPALDNLAAFKEFAQQHKAEAHLPIYGDDSFWSVEDPTGKTGRQQAIAQAEFATPGAIVKAFLAQEKTPTGWVRNQLRQLLIGTVQGTIGMAQQAAGVVAGLTGNEAAQKLSSGANADLQTFAQMSAALPSGQWTAKLAQGGTSILPALLGGFGAGIVGRALFAGRLAKMAPVAQAAFATRIGLTGSAGAAGLQSFGGTFGEAFDAYKAQGMSDDDARASALKPALASALTTAALTYGMGGGVESVFKAGAFAATAKQLIRAIVKGGSEEFTEEGLDQFIQGLIAKASYDPNKSFRQIVMESLEAGGIGAVLGGGVSGINAAEKQAPGHLSRYTPEALAAAGEEIATYAPEGFDTEAIANSRNTARALLQVADGNIEALDDSMLELIDVKRNAKGELENATTENGRRVRVKIENGKPIITQSILDKLEAQLPRVRAMIGMNESEARAFFKRPAAPATAAPVAGPQVRGTSSTPQDTFGPETTAATVPAQASSPSPSTSTGPATQAGTGTQAAPAPATSSSPQSTNPGRALNPEAQQRADTFATLLTESFQADPEHAALVAAEFIRREGMDTAVDYDTHKAGFLKWLVSVKAARQGRDAPMDLSVTVRALGLSANTAPPEKASPESPPIRPSASGSAVSQGPASPDSRQTAQIPSATALSSSELLGSPEFRAARNTALAGIKGKDPIDTGAKRKAAVKALEILDRQLERYGPLFPGGIRLADPAHNKTDAEFVGSTGGLLTDATPSGPALVLHLTDFLISFAERKPSARAIQSVVEEELIHRVTLDIFEPRKLAHLWGRLPAEIQSAVWDGYHMGSTPMPEKMERTKQLHMAHEFVRMLVQDSAFRGRVTESQDISPSLKESIVEFLRTLVDGLRALIARAPKELRGEIKTYEQLTSKALKELLESVATAKPAPSSSSTVSVAADLTAAGPSNLTPSKDLTSKDLTSATQPHPVIEKAITGSEGIAYTDQNDPIHFKYAIVSADDLVVSNADDGTVNPLYPQVLQPRDRTSVGSQAQVQKIASEANFDRLASSNLVSDGAPIIGDDGVVESGNGRLMGLRRAFAHNLPSAATYRDALMARLSEFGLDPTELGKRNTSNPVLVRLRTTPLDMQQRVAFAQAANVSTVAPMREAETARKDAGNLTPEIFALFSPDEDGGILTQGNAPFIRAFVRDVIPPTERAAAIDAQGNLSQSGLRRLRNALFVSAYGDSPAAAKVLTKLAESTEDSQRNLITTLTAAAPVFAEQKARMKAGTLHESLDLTPDVTAAVARLLQLREEGASVADFLAQDHIPGIGEDVPAAQRILLKAIDHNSRSPKRLREIFARYQSAVEGAGNPQQGALFGDASAQDKAALINLAVTYTPAPLASARRFDSSNLKSQISNPSLAVPDFYSQLQRVATEKMPNRAEPRQIRAILENPQNRIKQEELKWTGIVPWLESQSEPVAKEDVLHFLHTDGAVQFEEVRLSDPPRARTNPLTPAEQARLDVLGPMDPAEMTAAEQAEYEALNERALATEHALTGEFLRAETDPRAPKFGNYQLSGGKNYREIVLTMPNEKARKPDTAGWNKEAVRYNLERGHPNYGLSMVDTQEWKKDFAGLEFRIVHNPHKDQYILSSSYSRTRPTVSNAHYDDLDSAMRAAEIVVAGGTLYVGAAEGGFTSSHFPDTKNYVAHMRLNDRVDAEGAPGTLIEEIQSDRHQQGREKGYRGSRVNIEAKPGHSVQVPMWAFTPEEAAKWIAESGAPDSYFTKPDEEAGIPDAPFRSTWPLQMFKRALRDAVASGKAWIGWTTGDTQAARYDLSKQVDAIRVEKQGADIVVIAFKGESSPGMMAQVINQRTTPEKLSDLIGKDLARQFLESGKPVKLFQGPDLKVGGEGMKGFYDTILPKEIGKYVKQWGATVENGALSGKSMPMGERTIVETPIHRVTITPALREAVQQGQPLFSARRAFSTTPPRRAMNWADGLAAWEAIHTAAPLASARRAPRPRYQVVEHRYSEQRGTDGPFHDAWRILDTKTGGMGSLIYSSKEAAENAAARANETQPLASARRFTPEQAAKVYKKLFKLQQGSGTAAAVTLTPAQKEMMEDAERALGQQFMFDEVKLPWRPAENLTLETETATGARNTEHEQTPAQLSLFAGQRTPPSKTGGPPVGVTGGPPVSSPQTEPAPPPPPPVKIRDFDAYGRLAKETELPHTAALQQLRDRKTALQSILDCLGRKKGAAA